MTEHPHIVHQSLIDLAEEEGKLEERDGSLYILGYHVVAYQPVPEIPESLKWNFELEPRNRHERRKRDAGK